MEESLPIVTLGTVDVLGSGLISSSWLSSEENTAIALKEIFLEAKEAEILLKKHLAIWQVWNLSLECTYLIALELALESTLDESRDSQTYWELFWRPGGSTEFINDLFIFFELTIVVVRKRKVIDSLQTFFSFILYNSFSIDHCYKSGLSIFSVYIFGIFMLLLDPSDNSVTSVSSIDLVSDRHI